MAKDENIKTVTLSFQEYEIENILKVLDDVVFNKDIRRDIFWTELIHNQTTHDKIIKRLQFTKKSITRQLDDKAIKDAK